MYKTEIVINAINFIEDNLNQKIDLEIVANNLNYSKYYLHRVFAKKIGLTLHNYLQRRRLTEAAKDLVYTNGKILDIALKSGYQSQQAFTAIFRKMYKKTPNKFRKDNIYYPLQYQYEFNYNLDEFYINDNPDCHSVQLANKSDIPSWLELLNFVIDGYPGLIIDNYIYDLNICIDEKRTLVIKHKSLVIAAMIFDYLRTEILFFAVHPLYRGKGIEKVLLNTLKYNFLSNKDIYITTFRDRDKADVGYRQNLLKMGFKEIDEFLIEYGYPTQKLVLKNNMEIRK